MSSERRKFPRQPASIPATLVWHDGLSRAAATITDHSVQGAMVQLEIDQRIHGDCYILFRNRMEPCRLVWQVSRQAGLLFLDVQLGQTG